MQSERNGGLYQVVNEIDDHQDERLLDWVPVDASIVLEVIAACR
jgi:hypothetical protein